MVELHSRLEQFVTNLDNLDYFNPSFSYLHNLGFDYNLGSNYNFDFDHNHSHSHLNSIIYLSYSYTNSIILLLRIDRNLYYLDNHFSFGYIAVAGSSLSLNCGCILT